MSNIHDLSRDEFMLTGSFAKKGYDWWWHCFTAENEKTGKQRSFFIEYFTCNPAEGGKEPVLGQLAENRKKNRKPSYLMIKAGWWGEDHAQLHRFFGWDEVKLRPKAPFGVKAGDCFASETRLKGQVSLTEEEAKVHPEYMCGGGSMKWDLTVEKQIAFHVGYGASAPFRAAKAFEMYWHAEGMKTAYSGTVICNGERYVVSPETSYGYADKNWGRDFTSPWVWLSSCNLTSLKTGKRLEHSAFDIGGGRPKIYFVPLDRKLLGALNYEGKDYEFNFSKFWTGSRTRFRVSETDTQVHWHVCQGTRKYVMVTDVVCDKKEMLIVNYEAPDGSRKHDHLWNGGTGRGRIRLYRKTTDGFRLIDELLAENVGCEYGEYGEERKQKEKQGEKGV